MESRDATLRFSMSSGFYAGALIQLRTVEGGYYALDSNARVPASFDFSSLGDTTAEVWSAPGRSLKLPLPSGRDAGARLVGYSAAVALLLLLGRLLRRPGIAWALAGAGGLAAFGGLAAEADRSFRSTLAGASLTLAEGAVGGRFATATSSVAIYSPEGFEGPLAATAPAERILGPPRALPGVPPPLPLGATEGARARVRLAPRAAAALQVTGALPLGGGITAVPLATGEELTGFRLENRTGRRLRDVQVLAGSRRSERVDLSPDSGATVALSPGRWERDPPESPEPARRRALVPPTGSFPPDAPVLWFDTPGDGARPDEGPRDLEAAVERLRDALGRVPLAVGSLVVLAETDGPLAEVSLPGRRVFTPGPTLLVMHGAAGPLEGGGWPVVLARGLDPDNLGGEPSPLLRGRSRRVGEPLPSPVPIPGVLSLTWPVSREARLGLGLRFAPLPPRGWQLVIDLDLCGGESAVVGNNADILRGGGHRLPDSLRVPSPAISVLQPTHGRLTPLVQPDLRRVRVPNVRDYLDDKGEARLQLDFSRLIPPEDGRQRMTEQWTEMRALLALRLSKLRIRAARLDPGAPENR